MKRITLLFIFLFYFSVTNADEINDYYNNSSAILLTDSAKAYKFYKKGLVLTESKNYKEAFEYFSKAIKSNPNFAEAYLKRAIVAYEAKIYQNLWSDYDMAIKLKPDYGEAYYARGSFKTQIDGNFPPRAGNEDFKKAKELGYEPPLRGKY